MELVRLPQSSQRSARGLCHVKVLTCVLPDSWNGAGFEGRIYPPGASVSGEELGPHPVALECAGPQGMWKRGRARPTLWILWRYEAPDWQEIARATALDWSWALILRAPAIRALMPPSAEVAMVDPVERGREVTTELLERIDAALTLEPAAVRAHVLTSIYDSIAGRIVAA